MAVNFTYSRALRVLGQILESNGVDLFEIRSRDDGFYLLWGDPMPPHLAVLEMSYSTADLRSLDLRARSKRQTSFGFVECSGLAETLRALGSHVERKEGRLLRICNCESPPYKDSIQLEYEGRDGRRYVEELTPAVLSNNSIRMHEDRERIRREQPRK